MAVEAFLIRKKVPLRWELMMSKGNYFVSRKKSGVSLVVRIIKDFSTFPKCAC